MGCSTQAKSKPFTFKARKICVSLYAPLFTSVKKSNSEIVKVTGTPKGKTVVEFLICLEKYITKPVNEDDNSEDSIINVSNRCCEYNIRLSILTRLSFCDRMTSIPMNPFHHSSPSHCFVEMSWLKRLSITSRNMQWRRRLSVIVPNCIARRVGTVVCGRR